MVLTAPEIPAIMQEFHTDPTKGGHGGRDYMLQAIGIFIFKLHCYHSFNNY